MVKDDNNGKDDNGEDNGKETATMARITGKDGEDNRQGQQQRQR